MKDLGALRQEVGMRALRLLIVRHQQGDASALAELGNWYTRAVALLDRQAAARPEDEVACDAVRQEVHDALVSVPGLQVAVGGSVGLSESKSNSTAVKGEPDGLPLTDFDSRLARYCQELVAGFLKQDLGVAAIREAELLRRLRLVMVDDGGGPSRTTFILPGWSAGTVYRPDWQAGDPAIRRVAQRAAYYLAGREGEPPFE